MAFLHFQLKQYKEAEVHAWLAWQGEPGKPFGQAVAARYFLHDAAVAARFVAWFKQVYGLAAG